MINSKRSGLSTIAAVAAMAMLGNWIVPPQAKTKPIKNGRRAEKLARADEKRKRKAARRLGK